MAGYVIVGYDGTEIEVIGRLLARKLSIECYDLDEIFTLKHGSKNTFLSDWGIEAYRKQIRNEYQKILINPEKKRVFVIPPEFLTSEKGVNKIDLDDVRTMGRIIYLTPSEFDSEAIQIINSNKEKHTKEDYLLQKACFESIYDEKIITQNKNSDQIIKEILNEQSY